MLYECWNAVLNVVCVFLALPSKTTAEQCNALTSPSGVFWMPFVLFTMPGKETADQWKTLLQHPLVYVLQHPLVCFECPMCSLHCLLKDTAKQYNTFLHHPLVCFECYLCSLQCPAKKQQTSLIHYYITLWCVLKALCVSCTARKGNGRPVWNILSSPSGVFWMSCVLKKPSGVFWTLCVFLTLSCNKPGQVITILHGRFFVYPRPHSFTTGIMTCFFLFAQAWF